MENATSMGMNRTGTHMSPVASKSMQTYAEEHSPAPQPAPDGQAISALRSDYAHAAERVGSVPMPGTMTGAVSTGASKLLGKNPEVLIDKLGERLAFERNGVRLYQALRDKIAALDDLSRLPFGLADLEHVRDEELKHMHLVANALESLGADPTAQTPSADVAGVAASGVMQVLTDPRTTVPQCLGAVLTAELTDHAAWEMLIRLAQEAGQDGLLDGFREAHRTEEEHLQKVKGWLATVTLAEVA